MLSESEASTELLLRVMALLPSNMSETASLHRISFQLSVIIPVYNGSRYLPRCLAALRQSTYPDYELIVVDNGSTDNSVAIAQSFQARILHCPGPSGPGAARNMGAQHAAYDVLVFIDADVVIHSDVLSRIARHFQHDPELAALFGSYDTNPSATNLLSQYKNLLHHYVHQHANEQARTFWAGCGAIRKDLFMSVGMFDTVAYSRPSIEDIELGDRLYRGGLRITLDKQLLAQHLKEWRLRSLVHADVWCRAIPWSQLILTRQGMLNDLNVGQTQRISALATWLGLGSLFLGLLYPIMLWGTLLALVLVLSLNQGLFGFFWRLRGPVFTGSIVPIHLFYFLYSSLAFAWVAGTQLFPSRRS